MSNRQQIQEFAEQASRGYSYDDYEELGKNLVDVPKATPGTLSGAAPEPAVSSDEAQKKFVKLVKGAASANLSDYNREEIIKYTAEAMSPEQKKKLAETITSGLGAPTQRVRDRLWTIIVYTFAIVMILVVGALCLGAFMDKPESPVASGEILLSVFTAVVGFFGGLFVKSPTDG